MIKFVKKNKLQFVNGFICDKKGNVLGGFEEVARLANNIEDEVQQQAYLKAQPEAIPMPSLDGFVRESINKVSMPTVGMPETPVTDARIEEALAFAHEMQNVHDAKEINELFEKCEALYKFVNADVVPIDTDPASEDLGLNLFDTPTLGNPLDWDDAFITKILLALKGYVSKED